MPVDPTFEIPESVLIPPCNSMTRQTGRCADNWTPSEIEVLKGWCGTEYAHIPPFKFHQQAINLRKRQKLEKVNGHGPTKRHEPDKRYLAYLQHPGWKNRAERVRQAWGYRCAIDNSMGPLEVHHRTYDHILWDQPGAGEHDHDLIPLCRYCHVWAGKAMARAKNGNDDGDELF